MFHSNEEYSGLDNFFRTNSNENHLRKNDAILKRIKDLEKLYRKWSSGPWNFSKDERETQERNNDCHETVEIMREANLNYILGFFNSSIIMSSIAVERLLKCIMLLNFKNECFKKVKIENLSELHPVRTVYGLEPFYYGYHKSNYKQIYKLGNEYYEYKIGLKYSMKKALTIGLPINRLLDKNEESKLLDNKDVLFIIRRNNAAHGFYINTTLGYEQLQRIESNETIDMVELLKFGRDAYDQYSKASNFVIDTFINFEKNY
jgi:hypothetical protein